MTKMEIKSTEKVSGFAFLKALTALTEMPVSSVEDFKKRRRLMENIATTEVSSKELSIESEDFKFLKAQFEWGLSNRALAGNDVWELISQAFEGATEK